MDIFLMTKQNLSLQLFIARRSEVPGDAVIERRMYTAEKKKIVGWCNSSTKQVDKAIISFAFLYEHS